MLNPTELEVPIPGFWSESRSNMAPPSNFTLRTGIYPAIDPENFEGALKGKVALVTGSGRGIGKNIALALSQAGAAVAVTGRTKAEVEDTTTEILASGGRAIGVVADGLDRQDLQKLVIEVRIASQNIVSLLLIIED